MEWVRGVGILDMMEIGCLMEGTGERGMVCHLIHLRKQFKPTRISGHEQEQFNGKLTALDVVVPDNCGSGHYCLAREIDKTLAKMIGDEGIDGTKAWPSLTRRSPYSVTSL